MAEVTAWGITHLGVAADAILVMRDCNAPMTIDEIQARAQIPDEQMRELRTFLVGYMRQGVIVNGDPVQGPNWPVPTFQLVEGQWAT